MINKILLGLVISVAVATVGNVWLVQYPAISGIQANQLNTDEDIKYIRDRVDKIYEKVVK